MALYTYQAFSRDGKKVTGSLDATSSKMVKSLLLKQGIYPVSIKLAADGGGSRFSLDLFLGSAVSEKDKIFFTEQITVLLKAGVPLVDSLTLLADQTKGKLKRIVVVLRDGLQEGRSLSAGLLLYPGTFETLYVQLVKAGEISGDLDTIFDRLATYLRRRLEIKQKVQSAMMYPLIQLVVVIGVVAALLVFVVPQVIPVLRDQGKALPLATSILITLSDFVRAHYLFLIAVPGFLSVLFYMWKKTAWGSRFLDVLLLRTPLIGHFLRTNTVVSFCRTLGMLLSSGASLSDSLDIVCNIVNNSVLADALRGAREQIIKQGRVAEYLRQTELFPAMAIYLIDTGEQSGNLDTMLLQVARQYEQELDRLTSSLVSIINPVFLILVAVLVGFSVFAIMSPILSLATSMG